MVAMVVQKMITTIMSNHMFKWGRDAYLQEDGRPIGLRMTGSTCHAVMDRRCEKLKKK